MSRPEPGRQLAAAALDLGSTNVKAGLLDPDGRLVRHWRTPAPPIRGSELERTGDPLDYAEVVERLLGEVAELAPDGLPLGISTQRSSFLVWDVRSGEPRTPLVSWQDCRGAAWCASHVGREREIQARTGLVLSGHYLGPKLATMQESDASFRSLLRSEHARVGTLESFLVWRWSREHRTDPTVAARTLLFELESADWSESLLETFDVPRGVLPRIVGPRTQASLVGRLSLRATVADQAAAALAAFPASEPAVVVNLGTGAFVMAPAADPTVRKAGILTGAIDATQDGRVRCVLEGPVNGIAAALAECGSSRCELLEVDPSPDALCLPDRPALGAPHWRADVADTWSEAAAAQRGPDRRRVVLEGLLFRVREILDELGRSGPQNRVLLCGGLGADPFVAPGLAALLERPVERLEASESSLLGAGRLAAGIPAPERAPSDLVAPGAHGRYLPAKYERWRDWLAELLRR